MSAEEKHGIYKLEFSLHSWALGPVDENFKNIDAMEWENGYTGKIFATIPYRPGDFEPKELAEVADIVKLSEKSIAMCCSDKFVERVASNIFIQPHRNHKIILLNRSKQQLSVYHVFDVKSADRIPVLDYKHSQLDGTPALDGKPQVFSLAYCKKLYIQPERLPEYDLFLSEGHRWMATAKVLKLCKQHRIKGLKFDWIEAYKPDAKK
ncbi:MAG: hypothetical protein SFX18_09755 [Pirellulales bacterium]|nr:hypothetical protein [Pirellulales bacterium]